MAFPVAGLKHSVGIVFGSLVVLGSECLGRKNLVPVVNEPGFVQHPNRLLGHGPIGIDLPQFKLYRCLARALLQFDLGLWLGRQRDRRNLGESERLYHWLDRRFVGKEVGRL